MRRVALRFSVLSALACGAGGCSWITEVEPPGEPPEAADTPDPTGPTLSTDGELAEKRYVAAGDRAYVIGAEDGSFPPMGWHIRGEMGGVWAHPIKLLDGYWFALDGAWTLPAARFSSGAGYARFEFPEAGGLALTRTEFSPDGSPVVLVRLDVRNTAGAARDVELRMAVRSELMTAYGWGWTTPSALDSHDKDQGAYDEGAATLTFQDSSKPWSAVISAAPAPAGGEVGDTLWGPIPEEAQPDYLENGKGTGGELRWQLRAPAGEQVTVWIAIAGSPTSPDEAAGITRSALEDPGALLTTKIKGRLALLARTQVDLPDAALKAAFDWSKLNMADLRITVPDVQVRDVNEGEDYPAPLATLSISGIGAGFPDYPWLFGTDGAYTSFPLVASGQWDTAQAHLRSIRDVSRVLNGGTGKVVHEVVTDGSVYFGSNTAAGNTNETAQFAIAVDLLWRWSGDDAFRDEMLDFIQDGLETITSTLDEDNDGWSEGHGMVERSGMGSEKLDVAAYTREALRALERMATAKGHGATATWAKGKAEAMEAAFEAAWWMPDQSRYADSLCNAGDEVSPEEQETNGWTNVCEAPDTQLEQRHWINAAPMEVGLAAPEHAAATFEQLEAASGPCGLYHTSLGGGPDEKGELKCWTLPTSVLAVGEANYGRLRDNQALYYMRSIADLLHLEMPGALPEIAASPGYDPFDDFRERAMFMQAWSPYGVQWPVIHSFLGIDPDVPAKRLAIMPDVPEGWPGLSVRNLRVGTGVIAVAASRAGNAYTTTVDAPAGLTLTLGHTLPAEAEVVAVTLDEASVEWQAVDTPRGREVRVEVEAGVPHTLVVTGR